MAEFEQILDQDERRKLTKKNRSAIKKALSQVDPDTLKLNEQLIDEAARYATALYECNLLIERDGLVDFYQNGENQWGTKKSVAAELKPKYTSTYQALIKQLSALLPTESEKNALQELTDFLQGA